MKQLVLALLMAGSLFSCSTTTTTEQGANEALAMVANLSEKVSEEPKPHAQEAEGTNYRITYQDVTRILTVWNNHKETLKFRLQVMDAEGDCENDLSGEAKLVDGDSETRENSEGETVPADQYNFEMEGCGISILIQMDGAENAWVEQWDCPSHEGNCSFGTPFALPKVD